MENEYGCLAGVELGAELSADRLGVAMHMRALGAKWMQYGGTVLCLDPFG